MPPALARFESAHPDVKIELEQMERAEALRRLRAGELDIAVIWDEFEEPDVEEQRTSAGFQSSLLGQDPYRVVLPVAHRLARRKEVNLADLARERFNGPGVETSQRYRAMLDRLCADAGFEPDVAYIVRDVTVGRAFVAAGVCVGVLPELAIEEPRPDVVVRPLRGLNPARPLHAVWLRGRRVPTIPAMERALAGAAAARLGAPA